MDNRLRRLLRWLRQLACAHSYSWFIPGGESGCHLCGKVWPPTMTTERGGDDASM